MASVFSLLEAFNRKEAAALGFFPCATASFLKKDKVLHIALMQAMTILQQSNETYITQGI